MDQWALCEHLHATKAENTKKQPLLFSRQLQALHDRHGENDNHQIRHDVDGGVREPGSLLIDARSLCNWNPEFLDRCADKKTRDDCCNGVRDDDGDETPAPYLKSTRCEDALVLEKDGELGQADGCAVHAYTDV